MDLPRGLKQPNSQLEELQKIVGKFKPHGLFFVLKGL
jgi:hypothetical protein